MLDLSARELIILVDNVPQFDGKLMRRFVSRATSELHDPSVAQLPYQKD